MAGLCDQSRGVVTMVLQIGAVELEALVASGCAVSVCKHLSLRCVVMRACAVLFDELPQAIPAAPPGWLQ